MEIILALSCIGFGIYFAKNCMEYMNGVENYFLDLELRILLIEKRISGIIDEEKE